MGTFVIGVSTVICILHGGTKITGLVKAEGPKYLMIETVENIELVTIEKNLCVVKQ